MVMISFNKHTLILTLGLFCVSTAIKHIQCPDSSQWKFRQSGFCNATHQSYHCLYDENLMQYAEFCWQKPNLQRPGYKFIVRGNLDGSKCIKSRYQPTKFWTNESSECIFKKSNCREEGLIIHTEGNSASDKTCRCDYTKGYAFVNRPVGKCFCNPITEDCSCYRNPCKESEVLTPDYNCIRTADWTGIYNCTIIKKQKTDVEPTEKQKTCPETCSDKIPGLKRYAQELIIFTATLILFSIFTCIGIPLVMLFTLKYQEKMQQINNKIKVMDEKVAELVNNEIKELINPTTERINELQKWQEDTRSNRLWCCLKENYIEIIATINNHDIMHHLMSKEILTAIDKKEIDECLGQRKKNQKLLEILLKIGGNALQEFMSALTQNEAYAKLEAKIKGSKGTMLNDVDIQDDYNDKIPKKERDVFNTYIASWYEKDKKFTVTRVTREIETMLEQRNCVFVIGSSGNGKSAIIRHLALKLFNEEGFDIVPIVLPNTVMQYYNPERKQIFIFDDFCGKKVINAQVVDIWSLHIHDVLKLIINNQENTEQTKGKGAVKLLFANEPSIYEDKVFNRIDLFSKYKFNISKLPLLAEEKWKMINKYITKKQMSDSFLKDFQGNEEIFPLICKHSEGKTEEQIIKLLAKPYDVIKLDILALNRTNKNHMCLIALCVLLGCVHEDVFRQENTPEKDKVVMKIVCSEFDLDLRKESTKSKLSTELKNLEQTYLAKLGDSYHIEHKEIYDIAAVVCGEIIKESFIRFAPSSIIAEQYSFIMEDRRNLIFIDGDDVQKRYFDRLMNDLERTITYSTFHNSQLKCESYRVKFCKYCSSRKQKLVELLNRLQKCISESSENPKNKTTAISEDSTNEYEDYIDFNEKFHFSSHKMKKPLIESAWEGYEDIVNLLINMGCDINETDKFGRSALFVACRLGKTNAAVQLLNNEAKHSLCDANATSPLHAACKGGFSTIVEALLEKGADMSTRDSNGYSPFLLASEAGHIKIVEKLLHASDQKNANIFQHDNFDRSALFLASTNGRKEVVDLLLKNGAELEECDRNGLSPLLAACSKGKLNVVTDLLKMKADVKKIDNDGRSALVIACQNRDNRIVNVLLQNKADVSQCDWNRQSPLFIACALGDDKNVRLLVNYEANISQCDENGRSPFFMACEQGHDTIFDILLPKCGDEVLEKADNKGRLPLYVACKGGFKEIVKKLVFKGAQINKCNEWQMTPLHVACREGHYDVVHYLVTAKADLNPEDYNGQTPLSVACDCGYADVVTILVETGADVNQADNDHKTPVELAKIRGHTNIVDILNEIH